MLAEVKVHLPKGLTAAATRGSSAGDASWWEKLVAVAYLPCTVTVARAWACSNIKLLMEK